ncbi:hypothetical protein Tco_0126955 [Tanacetum coccineum]
MANKHLIMTREMVESFYNNYYIPDEVHPTAPGRDRTITQFPEGKVGVYTRLFDYCGYRIPLTKFFVAVLKYELELKEKLRAKYDARGALLREKDAEIARLKSLVEISELEKDPGPHLTARQEQAVQVLSSNKAPFRRYPECFLALVGLSPYYPFGENTYPAFERPDRTDMGLLDYIRTADPRKVQAVEVQKGEEQDPGKCSWILHCPEASAPSAGENVVAEEDVIPVGTYVDLVDPEGDLTVVKTLASLRRTILEGSLLLGSSSPAVVHTQVTVRSSHVADAPVYTAADTVTSSRDSKRWYIPRWNITNDSLLDDGFSCRTLVDRVAPPGFFSTLQNMDYDQLFEEFNVGAGADRRREQICLGRRRKKNGIARLKSLVKEKETESAEVLRLRDQVSVLAADKSFLSAEVSALKSAVSQKDTDISLLDSRASYLKSALDDSQAACNEARNLISSLSSERDGLASEVSTLHSAFRDFKEKMEAQQEAQAQELYNRVAELEAHSPEYQGILGHALGRAVDYGMQEGLAAGHEHGVAGTPLSAVVAYNPETAESNYLDAVRALEEADFPLVHLLKSKKDSGMDEVLDCFLLDGPLADLPEATHLQPCLEQLSVPIYHADVNVVAGETSLSFALLNVHARAEGAKKHAAALRQLMVDIVSHPLSSQNLLGEAGTSAVAFCVEDLDTNEDLGSVVCMPQFEDPLFEIFP